MDGLTAVKHIREEEAAGRISLNLVIALSGFSAVVAIPLADQDVHPAGNARQEQIDEARASGMDEGEQFRFYHIVR